MLNVLKIKKNFKKLFKMYVNNMYFFKIQKKQASKKE